MRAASLLVALALAACTRAAGTSPPPHPDETCARLSDLYAKERLPYDRSECMKMVTALNPDEAACFDRCTSSDSMKTLIACQTECRPPR